MIKDVRKKNNSKRKPIILASSVFIVASLLSGYTVASWESGALLGFSNIISGDLKIEKESSTRMETDALGKPSGSGFLNTDYYYNILNQNIIVNNNLYLGELSPKDLLKWHVADDNNIRALQSYGWMTDYRIVNKGDNMVANLSLDFSDFSVPEEYKTLRERLAYLGNGWRFVLLEKVDHNPDLMLPLNNYLEGGEWDENLYGSKPNIIRSGAITVNGITDTYGMFESDSNGIYSQVKKTVKADIGDIPLEKDSEKTYTLVVIGELTFGAEDISSDPYVDKKIVNNPYKKNNVIDITKAKLSVKQVR